MLNQGTTTLTNLTWLSKKSLTPHQLKHYMSSYPPSILQQNPVFPRNMPCDSKNKISTTIERKV